MISQQALHISCNDGGPDLVELKSPQFVGPVEYAWSLRSQDDPTVFGVGPLAGTCVPGASGLVVAGRSPLWDGFHATSLEGGGLILPRLGCDLIVLRGRAPRPSVLVVCRKHDRLQVRLEPLDPNPLWQGTHDGEGVYGLLLHLLHHHFETMSSLQVLASGPAAELTRYGSLCSAYAEQGQILPVHGWLRRGGVGSRLFQAHHLCALVMGCDQTGLAAAEQRGNGGSLSGRFAPGMSIEELEQSVHSTFNPKLKAWGSLGATLSAVRQRILWFNGSSIFLSNDERDLLSHRALRNHYLARLIEAMLHQGNHQTCGAPCPIACKGVIDGKLKEVEPYVALGPQIGVLDPSAADRIVALSESMGFDSFSLGSILAWLMERLSRQLVQPGFLGVKREPRWSARDFDPVTDSEHNAELARGLTEGILFADWGTPLRKGLRHGATTAGGPSASLAVYNANGDTGEMAAEPYWAPGFFTPMPIAGEHHQYYGIDFVPPRVLGRKSAQRMIPELMLQNFGVCRLHRAWSEVQFAELVNQHHSSTTNWESHHRDLARRIFRRRKARFWETARVIDIIEAFLLDYHHDAAPDGELDRWVHRFHKDKASAARAYWSEINAGLEEILGS